MTLKDDLDNIINKCSDKSANSKGDVAYTLLGRFDQTIDEVKDNTASETKQYLYIMKDSLPKTLTRIVRSYTNSKVNKDQALLLLNIARFEADRYLKQNNYNADTNFLIEAITNQQQARRIALIESQLKKVEEINEKLRQI